MKPFYDEGRYICRVTQQALGKAKTGTPQFVLRFLVLGTCTDQPGEYDEVGTQYERTMYRYITDKTITYFAEDLAALGFTGETFKLLDPNQNGFYDFKGMEVAMFCSHRNDQNGDLKEEWGVARGVGELKVDPLEPKGVRELDNLFGKHLKGLKPAAPQTAKAQPQSGAREIVTDEDVPF